LSFSICGARALTAEGLCDTTITVCDGVISSLGGKGGEPVWQATGLLALPGIVDLHGDAFERQLMPRPGVHFPIDLALLDTDRQLVANGITTAFHGLTCSWEPGLRSRAAAVTFLQAIDRLRPEFCCDTFVHLRHEIHNVDAVDDVEAWLTDGRIGLLAFNDHLPMFQRRLSSPSRLTQIAERAGLTVEQFIALIHQVAERAPEIARVNRRLAAAARSRGVALASHDDETPETRRLYHDLGCALCEFPVNRETARIGRELGDTVIMGAPNVVRGGSHIGGMGAAEMVAEGVVDVLTSDYYYPSLLHGAFRLAADGICSLSKAWRRVSTNPARAAGLADRGEIAEGQRADLILIDQRNAALPRVVATVVGGRLVYAGGGWHP
jgi:alpha-D-ribose 1-methylphosphonate 5-triphosphate diphosphatase